MQSTYQKIERAFDQSPTGLLLHAIAPDHKVGVYARYSKLAFVIAQQAGLAGVLGGQEEESDAEYCRD